MNRRAVALLSAPLLVAPLTFAAPPRPAAAARLPTLELVKQTLTVAADGILTMTVRLPQMDPAQLAKADIVVTAYRRVDTREGVRNAIDGDLPHALDDVHTSVADGVSAPAGEVTLTMPIETNRLTPEGLQLANPGLYPLVVDLRAGGDPLAEVVTFVNRLSSPQPTTYDTLPVALAMDVNRPVALHDDGSLDLNVEITDELVSLGDTLSASAIAATVHLPAHAITALRNTNPDAADRLVRGLTGNTLLSAPTLPLDPSSAANADLRDLYTQWLRDGEDVLDQETGVRSSRSLVMLDAAMSAAGASLVRDAGAQALLVSPEIVQRLSRRPRGELDPTRLVSVDIGGDARLDALIVDPRLADLLAHPVGMPASTAIYAVAELLAARMEILESGASPARHGVLLGLPDLGVPAAPLVSELSALIGATAELRATTAEQIVATADRQALNDEDVTLALPDAAGVDLHARTELAAALGVEASSAGSMLPKDDPRHARWQATTAMLPTTGLSDDQVDGLAQRLRDDFAALRAAVHLPAPFKFSLTGRRSTIRFNVQNDSATALTVRLRMSSPKLTFPEGEQTVVLAANASTQVAVPVEARTSGEYGVSLDVLAPVGETPLAPTVPLTASLTTISGLGNFITGAALLILLTWWVRHWRMARRRRLAVAVAGRHPSGRDAGQRLSPDAATSTLPPP